MMMKGHPKGLYLCFSVEMWERFSFYGMRAILVLFMTKYLLFDTKMAGTVYGWYLGLVYLTPLIGGYIADRYWGKSKAIIFGGLVMAAGQFLLAGVHLTNSLVLFTGALIVLVVGCGFIKANISSAVGDLYEPGDARRDGAFTIFYMGINLGALFAPLICGTLGERVGWGWGFFAAGIGMLLGVINYVWLARKMLPESVFHPGGAVHKHEDGTKKKHEPFTKEEKQKIAVIFIMAFFVVFFWSAFEQAGSSLTLFAEHSTDRFISFLNWQVPTSYFQSLNPLFIFILAPIFASLWVKLAKMRKEPTTPIKFVWGLALLAVGFVVMAGAAAAYKTSGLVSMWWLIGAYLLHTIGELCLSPVGLSLVTKLSPARFVSLLMGTWFTANFFANLLSGLFAGNYDLMDHVKFFMIPVYTAGAAAVLLFILAKPIKKWMHDVH